ncbi:PAS domain-containing protein, partial [Haematococcus lacustris]
MLLDSPAPTLAGTGCLGPAAPDRAFCPAGPEQAAKKNKPGLLDRFAIFIREQQHTQKAGDLVNYVEQQRKYRMALRLHKDALLAMRSFWQCLLHTSIEMSKLRDALELVDLKVKAGKRCAPHCLQPLAPAAWPGMRSVPLLLVTPSAWPAADLLCCAAEQLYRSQLAGASTNVKLLRLYAKFLEHIKHDPWGAAKWTAEARRLQLIEDERKDNIFSDMGGNNGDENQPAWVQHMKSVDPGKAVIVMDAQCIVQAANQVAHTMFGYAKNELR